METHSIASSRRPKSLLVYHLCALFAVGVWGASFVATKELINAGMSPVEIYVIRFAIAYVAMLAICHKRLFANNLRDESLLALCGISGISVYFIAENIALEYTYAANVSLITAMSPLITTLLMGVFYRSERPAPGVYLGSLIAITGVGCVVFQNGFVLKISALGDVLSLAAAFCWAFYAIILIKLNAVYDAKFVTRKTFFYGVVTGLPFLIFEKRGTGLTALADPTVLGYMLFLALIASLICFLLWTIVNHRLGTITANNYTYFQPVSTIILGFFILHEEITVVGIAGCALILLGLYTSDKLGKKRA